MSEVPLYRASARRGHAGSFAICGAGDPQLPEPSSLNPAPCTLHPAPCTLNPAGFRVAPPLRAAMHPEPLRARPAAQTPPTSFGMPPPSAVATSLLTLLMAALSGGAESLVQSVSARSWCRLLYIHDHIFDKKLLWFSRCGPFTRIGHIPGGRPLLRKGGLISYQPRPEATFPQTPGSSTYPTTTSWAPTSSSSRYTLTPKL